MEGIIAKNNKYKAPNQKKKKKILISKNTLVDQEEITNVFNRFLLASDTCPIPNLSKPWKKYANKHNSEWINNSTSYDDIDFVIIKKYFALLHKSLNYLFDLSLKSGLFPDSFKATKATPSLI